MQTNHLQLAENMWVSLCNSVDQTDVITKEKKSVAPLHADSALFVLHISMVMEWVRMLHSDWSIDLLNRALQPHEDILFSISLAHVKSSPVSSFLMLC